MYKKTFPANIRIGNKAGSPRCLGENQPFFYYLVAGLITKRLQNEKMFFPLFAVNRDYEYVQSACLLTI
jgi:hypothetical protein